MGSSESRLGKYELLERLAVGDMADVHLAREMGSQRLVVVKRANKTVLENAALGLMFADAARLLRVLDHPNIVKVFDCSEVQERGYYVTEYVEGLNLHRLLVRTHERGETIPIPLAVKIAAAVADALGAAHLQRGADGRPLYVVHRDVSPSNIQIGIDGRTCLLDFGVARSRITDRLLAVAKSATGELSYRAPENATGQVSHLSDIYCLGAVLYQMTVGVPPLVGLDDGRQLLLPSALIEEFPPELEAIILKALEQDPKRRYSSAQLLVDALRSFAAGYRVRASHAELGHYVAAAMRRAQTAAGKPRNAAQSWLSDVTDIDPRSIKGQNWMSDATDIDPRAKGAESWMSDTTDIDARPQL